MYHFDTSLFSFFSPFLVSFDISRPSVMCSGFAVSLSLSEFPKSNICILYSYLSMNYAVNNSDFGLDVEDYLIGEVSDNSYA